MLRTKKSQCSLQTSKLNSSIFTTLQSNTQTMQRQIDNYTRRLQQDKRKFFRAQENFTEIKKQYDNKNKQLEKLKSKKHKTQLITLKAKISTLEGTLDQIINSYNQALAKNNRLKSEIDQLRKDKKTQGEKLKFLNQKIHKSNQDIQQKRVLIEVKKNNIQKMKEQIIKYRELNENQVRNYQNQINSLKKSFVHTGKQNDRKNKDQKGVKSQNMDTQPIIKLRLRNLITHNKQKIKIIQQYKKNMHLIYQNFQQIKQQSGIQSLDEITKTFLKHEQQNGFIYQYISRLNTNIEQLKQGNEQIKKKIQKQQEINKQRRILFSGTPQQQKRKKDFQEYKQTKQKTISQMNSFLNQVKPKLLQVFRSYNIISQKQDIQLTSNNIQSYLSQLQNLLNQHTNNVDISVYRGDFKQQVTRYTKLPPSMNDDGTINNNNKGEEKLLEREKLKDIASEYWDKKKMNRMVSSKGNQLRNDTAGDQ